MSWDILIQNFPEGVTRVDDTSDGFVPKRIGSRVDLIAHIQEIFPEVDFSDPAWGVLESSNYSIEFNMGRGEKCRSIMLHVRGDSGAVAAVTAIVEHLGHVGLRAYDIGAGDFFSPTEAQASFAEWRAFRDKVVSSTKPVRPETPEDPAAGN